MGGPNNITWTPAQDELCKAWLAQGFSRSQVAVKLNDEFQTRFTRCAVGGRAWRLKFISPERPKLGRKPRVYKYVPRHGKPPAPKPSITMECVEALPRNVTLLELGAEDCRFPFGHGPFVFCGLPKLDGEPYCINHAHLCRQVLR